MTVVRGRVQVKMPIAAAATNSLKITEKKARGGNNKVRLMSIGTLFNQISSNGLYDQQLDL